MLAGPKLAELPAGKPFVAPVFGQGRVLGAWGAESMDVEGIEEASFFLTGACSCQVKAQNPGLGSAPGGGLGETLAGGGGGTRQ